MTKTSLRYGYPSLLQATSQLCTEYGPVKSPVMGKAAPNRPKRYLHRRVQAQPTYLQEDFLSGLLDRPTGLTSKKQLPYAVDILKLLKH
ncbi:hypothetical protein Lal_00020025 [Lupinus albus]|nr:hypothetical protein Lal_00020025 [Lupinus albus]